jgi:hypothetical protein
VESPKEGSHLGNVVDTAAAAVVVDICSIVRPCLVVVGVVVGVVAGGWHPPLPTPAPRVSSEPNEKP